MDFLLIICAHQLPAFCMTNSVERLNQEDPQLITHSLDLARKTLRSSNKSAAAESHIVIATSHYSFPNLLIPKLDQWCHHLDFQDRRVHVIYEGLLFTTEFYSEHEAKPYPFKLNILNHQRPLHEYLPQPFQIHYDITRSNTLCSSENMMKIFFITFVKYKKSIISN